MIETVENPCMVQEFLAVVPGQPTQRYAVVCAERHDVDRHVDCAVAAPAGDTESQGRKHAVKAGWRRRPDGAWVCPRAVER